jgi:hypothetical protein
MLASSTLHRNATNLESNSIRFDRIIRPFNDRAAGAVGAPPCAVRLEREKNLFGTSLVSRTKTFQ